MPVEFPVAEPVNFQEGASGVNRREFLVGGAGSLSASVLPRRKAVAAAPGPADQGGHRFKLGIWLSELKLPFAQELDAARDLGAEYVWFEGARPGVESDIPGGEPCIATMSDADADAMGESVARRGLKLYQICAYRPFHNTRLVGLTPGTLLEDAAFRGQFDGLVRSMQIAARLGVGAVHCYGFCWPGEWSAGQGSWTKAPTWPMKWLTRGGVIAEVDLRKLVAAFTLILEQADKYGVDVVVGMRPFHYMSSTGNFRRLAESLGSDRLKVQWSPADNVLIGEWDAATAGFANLRPYLHGLHLKDVHVFDGVAGEFEWRPLGEGSVGYEAVLRNLRDHRSQAVLMVASHFRPAGGTNLDAMKINFGKIQSLIQQIEEGS